MRVQQERRANQGRPIQNIEGHMVKMYRPMRAARHLDPWGALERRHWCQHKSWKHYRKTQQYRKLL